MAKGRFMPCSNTRQTQGRQEKTVNLTYYLSANFEQAAKGWDLTPVQNNYRARHMYKLLERSWRRNELDKWLGITNARSIQNYLGF